MKKRSIAVIVAIAVILTVAVGGTLAWLVASSDALTNTFVAGDIGATISEDFSNGTKSNVKVNVTGNAPALVRAVIIVNWADASGSVSATPVTTGDYSMDMGTDWTGIGGYYYYNGIVQPNGQTSNLINTCTRTGTAPDGYGLQVTILAEAIQAEGGAAQAAWGYSFSNGSWS